MQMQCKPLQMWRVVMIKCEVVFDGDTIKCNGYVILKDYELLFIYKDFERVDDWDGGNFEQAIKYCLEN